jgi:hypothetical protein
LKITNPPVSSWPRFALMKLAIDSPPFPEVNRPATGFARKLVGVASKLANM